jgi:hypothetical protein
MLAVHTYPYYAPMVAYGLTRCWRRCGRCPATVWWCSMPAATTPTGVDLTHAQWQVLIPVLQEKALIPFLDLAYQGFGDGLEEDAYAVRALVQSGMCFLLANTLSKSMGVYAERCGALSVVCADATQAERVLGQLKSTVRQSYFSPPAHGSWVVARVLEDPQLRASWERDLTAMRERIRRLRHQLHTALTRRLPERDFSYLLDAAWYVQLHQLHGAAGAQSARDPCDLLGELGRMCISGLRADNVERVADAMAAVSVGMDETAVAGGLSLAGMNRKFNRMEASMAQAFSYQTLLTLRIEGARRPYGVPPDRKPAAHPPRTHPLPTASPLHRLDPSPVDALIDLKILGRLRRQKPHTKSPCVVPCGATRLCATLS